MLIKDLVRLIAVKDVDPDEHFFIRVGGTEKYLAVRKLVLEQDALEDEAHFDLVIEVESDEGD